MPELTNNEINKAIVDLLNALTKLINTVQEQLDEERD
jgi:hypothetical protein